MNKKGGLENAQILLFLFGIILGGMILLGVSELVISSLSDSQEQVLAKDLSFSISTMISSPNKLYFKYAPNTEEYDITIEEFGQVEVRSNSGTGRYEYVPLEGITIRPNNLRSVLSIPMQFENNELRFESQQPEDVVQFCSQIPGVFGEKTKISIETVNRFSNSKNSMEYIRDQIIGLNEIDPNSPIEFVSVTDDADIRLVLTFKEITNEDELILEYYGEEEIPNHQRLSCFIASEFLAIEGDYFTSYDEIREKTTEQITVHMGSWDGFQEKSNNDPGIFDKYTNAILEGLKKGVSD